MWISAEPMKVTKQVDKAIENYLKAIELDANYATAYLRVGILYSRVVITQPRSAAWTVPRAI